MAKSETLTIEVVKNDEKEIVFKLRQEYRPKLMPVGRKVDSLVSLALVKEGGGVEKVGYHKDM